jgi:ubiquinone/menaquinone biosynthesis C-methylase UbiE
MGANNLDFPDESFDAVYHSLMLHWTPNPSQAIEEMARVLKPGGVVFGTQITKPLASRYMNLINQVHEGVYGYFWEEEFKRWYEQAGVELSIATPAGVFKGRKFAG